MKKIQFYIMFLMLLAMLGCNAQSSNTQSEEKLQVAVSIVPQATFVEAIAGDLVDVVTMIPPGNSPVNYQPTPQQMTELSNSNLYFAIGVPTEQANILPEMKDFNATIKVVDLAEQVEAVYPVRYLDAGDEAHQDSSRDPHIWLSPKRVKVMVEIMTDELSEMDPENKDFYVENANAYIEELNALDEEIQMTLEGVEDPAFLIYHPAFGYFADDYGLEMIAVEKEGKEATAQDLKEIVNVAREKQIQVVFYQAEVDSKQSQTLADEIGAQSVMLAPLAPNYIENLRKVAEAFKEAL